MPARLPHRLALLLLVLPACRATATSTQPPVASTPVPAMAKAEPLVEPLVERAVEPVDAANRCGAIAPVVERHEGDLTVPANPQPGDRGRWGFGEPRTWVGPPVPAAVPLYAGTAELVELRSVGDQLLATYDTPSGAPGCPDTFEQSCAQAIRLFDACGTELWSIDPVAFFLRGKTPRRVDNVLYQDGVLYFDEACTIASTRPKGRCGALIAVDPVAGTLLWRTAAMRSSGPLLLHQGWLVTVYHYLGQQSYVHLLRPSDGTIGLRMKVEGGRWDFAVAADGHLQLAAFGDHHMHYVMSDWDTNAPKLVRVPGYLD